MTDERLKAWLRFWQFVLGTVVLGIFSTVISNQIQTREIEIKEQEANARFLAQALQEDVGVRRRLAQYFSQVTRSEKLRERWSEFAKLVEREYQETREEKRRLEQEAASGALDAMARDRLADRIAQLERELSPKPVAPSSIAPRVYVHISYEEQRALASRIADALKAANVLVPGIELRKGPPIAEFRYFRTAEREEAERVASTIAALAPGVVTRYVPGYEQSSGIRPNHFELWLAASGRSTARGATR